MPIPTYFSHSYRIEDQKLNKLFWELFSRADFSFFVDPPSDATIHAHLERMMCRCKAFVAVVNRRHDVPGFRCSRFVLYEYGLSIQARRPRLLLIDRRVPSRAFSNLDPDETHYFSLLDPTAGLAELEEKIARLKLKATNFTNRLTGARGSIALLVPQRRSACRYADRRIRQRIEQAADIAGFTVEVHEVPYEHNAMFALDLDRFEAVILDVSGRDLPEWVFAYLHGRLIPTIKLARLEPSELAAAIRLPPIVEGLRMDGREPGVESVTYWRDPEDLIWQLTRAFHKLDEEQTAFKSGADGVLYFDSIGRRPARVFISNAGRVNPLARRISEALRLRSIERFQYKEPEAIAPGSDWEATVRAELQRCDVFLALIGVGYFESNWCKEEMRIARERAGEIELLPYAVEPCDVTPMDNLQVADLPSDHEEAIDRIIDDIQERLLRDDDAGGRSAHRSTLLGGSQQAIIDTIRHLPPTGCSVLASRLRDRGVAVRLDARGRGHLRSRERAETLFAEVQRAEAGSGDAVAALVGTLVELAQPPHREIMRRIQIRISGKTRP